MHHFNCQKAERTNFNFFFLKFKRHNSVKNHRTRTKFEIDLYNLVNKLHMKYQLYICIPPKVSQFKRHNSVKGHQTGNKINSSCIFIRYIYLSNLSRKCATAVWVFYFYAPTILSRFVILSSFTFRSLSRYHSIFKTR